MSKANKQLVPKIRFEGFLNSWEKSSLDSYVKVVSGGTPDTKIKEYWGGDINWFAPAEIGNQRYVFSSERKITETGLKNSSAKLLPAHKTVLFTSRAGIGSMALLSIEACTNQGFQSLVVNTDKAETYFIYSMGKIITQSALKIASGSTFLEISGKALAGLQFNFPKIEEQTQIGNFFQQIDKLIELQTRAVESAETYKKAMLQKMFPQKGEKVPCVRFEGFSGDWEKKSFFEVIDYRNGKAHESEVVENGSYIIVNSKFVSTDGNIKKYSNTQIEPLYKGEIALVLSDVPNGKALGKGYLVEKDNKYTLNQRIAGLHPKENIDSYFLYIFVDRNDYFLRFDNGVGQTNLSIKDVGGFYGLYPTLSEQTQIGNFFQKLDQNIEAEKKKLEQYQTMKRAMLQRMFV